VYWKKAAEAQGTNAYRGLGLALARRHVALEATSAANGRRSGPENAVALNESR
jgi:hypothetical protein